MLTRFRFNIIIFILFFIIPISYSHAEDYYHEWNYGIVEKDPHEISTEFFVDKEKTDLVIDHKKKEIRLFRESTGNPIRFTNEDNMPIAYSLMTEEGIKQFAFDGTEMIEIGFLNIEIENPLAMATKQNSPDIMAAYKSQSSDENIIEYYGFDGFEMQGIPFLEIAGLKDIRSMAFLNDEVAAILTEDTFNIFGTDGSNIADILYLKLNNLENPLDFASDGEYNISLLSEEKITYFGFSGYGLVEIPALSISIGNIEGVSSPRHIASIEGQITFIDESKAYTFLRGNDQMHYIEALSVTSGLTNPMGLSINRNSNDVIILDELDDKSIIRYYKFDGTEMVEIPQLSLELENIVLGGGGLYNLKGHLISKPLTINNDYVDLFQIGVYASLEEDTSIKLFIYNGYETEVAVDDKSAWKPVWNLVRNKGDSKSILYRNYSKTSSEDWKVYEGGISKLYPIELKSVLGIDTNPRIEDHEVVEGEDGNLYLNPKGEDLKNSWINIPIEADLSKDSYVRFKMEFTSKEGKKTPKVFVPSERNKIDEIKDDAAIRILARRKPLIPIIDDIDPELSEPHEPNNPFDPNNPDYIPVPPCPEGIAVEGWVYTTTPTIKWHLPIIDEKNVDNTYQNAYQLVVMAISRGYSPALVTDIITDSYDEAIETVRNFKIPTSNDVNVEGPLYTSGSYQFAVFVRIWDKEGNASEFSVGKHFNVLAYERPRIEKIESTTTGIMDITTMIQKDMTITDLLKAKAGTAITFVVDAVGPMENDLKSDEDISIFYYTDIDDKDFLMENGMKKSLYPAYSPVNRFSIVSWTPAPITANVDNSVVKVHLRGDSSIGGRTIFCIPGYAEGIVQINDTVYKDWEVFLDGRD